MKDSNNHLKKNIVCSPEKGEQKNLFDGDPKVQLARRRALLTDCPEL